MVVAYPQSDPFAALLRIRIDPRTFARGGKTKIKQGTLSVPGQNLVILSLSLLSLQYFGLVEFGYSEVENACVSVRVS